MIPLTRRYNKQIKGIKLFLIYIYRGKDGVSTRHLAIDVVLCPFLTVYSSISLQFPDLIKKTSPFINYV